MMGVGAALAFLWLFERGNLRRWGAAERVAFWAGWLLLFAWGLAVQGHVPLPTLPQFTRWLFRPLWERLLTVQPNIYW